MSDLSNGHLKTLKKLCFCCLFFLTNVSAFSQNDLDRIAAKAEEFATKDFDKSIAICDSVLSKNKGESKWVGIFFRIRGKAYYFKGNFDGASKDYISAIKILEKETNQKELSFALIDQAKLYRKLKMFPQAIETYEKAQSVLEKLNEQNHLATVWNEWGVVYELMHDYSRAIEYYKKSLAVKEKLSDTVGIAYSNGFLSNVYMLKEDFATAETYAKTSMEFFHLLKDDFATALRSSDIALIHEKKREYNQAIRYLEYSDSIATAMGYPDLLSENYRRLANIYSSISDHKNAYNYYVKYASLRDSLFTVSSQKNIAELHIKHQTMEKDNRILQQENRHAKQRVYLVVIGSLLLLAILIAAFFYRTRKLKEEKIKREAAMQADLLRLEAQNALQNDRLRISRDLHDNIGANLTFIHSSVEELGSPEEAKWKDVKSMVDETIAELRRTVWLINKPSVKMSEWLVKLRDYYRKIEKVKIELSSSNDEAMLSSKQATALFRIIQETVNNSYKHSSASEIMVKVSVEQDSLSIKVQDNGLGFDIAKIEKGFGLDNIKQNAEELRGELTMDSKVGEGTSIVFTMPMNTNLPTEKPN